MAAPFWRDSVVGALSSPEGRTARLPQDAEALSERLPALLVNAERIANTVAHGIHGRRRPGTGETFWQFRHHMEGDTAASIDWRQSAKTQSYFVRENEWEVAESVWLWCDQSASMNYSYEDGLPTKKDRALILTMALGHLLLRAGERVGVLGEKLPPLLGLSAYARLGHSLLESDKGNAGLPAAVELPRHARTVIVSDFLAPWDVLHERLNFLAHAHARGHLVQVLDPAEEEFPFSGRTVFEDLEDHSELVVGRAERLGDEYREKLGALKSALSHWARRSGWTFTQHRTDRAPHLTLLQIHGLLSDPMVRDHRRRGAW